MGNFRIKRPGRVAVLIAALAVLAAACSNSANDAATTTSTSTTTSTTTTTAAPAAEPEEPPEVAWIVQIGSAQDDAFSSVSARLDEVVAAGYTDGEITGITNGDRDIILATVGTDAEVRHLDQSGTLGADEARGISGNENTVSCGVSGGSGDAAIGVGFDAWCGPVDAQGDLQTPHYQGGTDNDELNGVGMASEGAIGYTAGFTDGLFPGASDSTSGALGAGDALVWQIGPDGVPTWVRQFGSAQPDAATGAAVLEDDDALVVGFTDGALNQQPLGDSDAFIARFDLTGLPRWVRQFGSEGADVALATAAGGDRTRGTETFIAVGTTSGGLSPAVGGPATPASDPASTTTTTSTPDPITDPAWNAGGLDAFASAFDSTGSRTWTTQIGGTSDDDAAAVAIDGTTLLLTGTTSTALDTTGAPAAGGTDGFLAALDLTTGQLRWITQFGSPQDDSAHGITITEDGLVVVSGTTAGSIGEQPSAGGTDGFLIAFPLPASGGSVASSL